MASTVSSSKPSMPSSMLLAKAYSSSYRPLRTVPAVVVMNSIGCSRALMPSTITLERSMPCQAWISSISAPWTFRPSCVSLSAPSGFMTQPSYFSRPTISATRHLRRRDSAGDLRTMRRASSQMILAWSFFVAAQ